MNEKGVNYESIDDYIAVFPQEVQEILNTLRKVIREAAPEAKEKISYQMPTFVLHGNLVHFAAYEKFIGFYPAPSGIETFKEPLSRYKWSKGAVRFPIKEPLPYELISEIVRYRVEENTRLAESKRKK